MVGNPTVADNASITPTEIIRMLLAAPRRPFFLAISSSKKAGLGRSAKFRACHCISAISGL